ncbi:hypothetical protein [Bosea sp. OK403]|uniref:hypothetical protein n=1 Tax=Bosea sp. OK403 TaxID=1855286 RepID=UPI001587D827|nr:hypothetical protein [Bosea sp. OK403]
MANGTAAPAYYLCALSPGMGKSTTVQQFVRQLLLDASYDHVSVLICVGRLAEIQTYVEEMHLSPDLFAVFVSEAKAEGRRLNELGRGSDREGARILFTTQQMLESRVKRKGSFSQSSEFWFQGGPRRVRLWDEACLPARPLTVEVSFIQALIEPTQYQTRLRSLLDKLVDEIRAAPNDTCVDIPHFEDETALSHASIMSLYEAEPQKRQDIVRDLLLLQGSTVTVHHVGANKTAISYLNVFPDDLLPLMICDASGRVRHSYRHWADGRGNLVALSTMATSYRNMTIHTWLESGSKDSWGKPDRARKMIDAITDLVNSKPNEEWLILHHQQDSNRDLPADLRKGATNPERLKFVYWGSDDAKATNQYRDIENIVLAGCLYFPHSYYEAMTRLSRAMRPEEKMDKHHRKEIELGEHAHVILQAVCRGAARKIVDGDTCAPCNVYIIAAEASGIPKQLADIFPGHRSLEWLPKASKPVDRAVGVLRDWLSNSTDRRISLGDFRSLCGESDKSNFSKQVIRKGSFQSALKDLGLNHLQARGRGGSYIEREPMILPPLC